ncbi:MAG: hypothetical protein EHM34_00190 [Nitrosopumilales archaeon]|nr:MAG: hypothetical protein EHM34_00190 [Nitrosopumilales archaeon]
MAFQEQREEILFVVFGKEKVKPGQETNSYVVDEKQSIEGIIEKIRDSPQYKKVYQMRVKGVDKPLVITGKTGLVEQMGHGDKVVYQVKEGDVVRITYLGMFKTGKGKDAYNLKVEVDR